MKRMVDDFREYARVPPARLLPLDLNALIEEIATLYRTAGAPLVLALASELPQIEGDATQMRQVIHNLVGNAQEALAGRADARIVARTELAEICRKRRSGPGRSVHRRGQRAWVPGEYTSPCIRALCNNQAERHGSRTGHGEEDHRRTRRTHRGSQPQRRSRRRACRRRDRDHCFPSAGPVSRSLASPRAAPPERCRRDEPMTRLHSMSRARSRPMVAGLYACGAPTRGRGQVR